MPLVTSLCVGDDGSDDKQRRWDGERMKGQIDRRSGKGE